MRDAIGILDSGVGGISLLRSAVRYLPNENFIFYGDNRNAPYGPRPFDEIRELSAAAVDALLNQGVKALALGCNTITAAYAEQLRSIVHIPVIGMEPALKPASQVRKNGIVLAMATRATLSLDRFARLMGLYGEGVIPLEGVGLVELVESGRADSAEAHDALAAIFAPYLGEQVDAIVLGCTHYPFLRRQIESFFPGVPIFDGMDGTAQQLKRRLAEEGLLTKRTTPGEIEFQSSGGPEYIELMKRLFAGGAGGHVLPRRDDELPAP